MIHMQHRLSVLLITALLCPIPWVYGGTKKQSKTLARTVPAVSVQQERDQQQAELAALNANARPPWAGDDRQQAQALFACLKQRGIAIKSTFYKMLGLASLAQRSQLVSRCQAFFDYVDTKEIANTSCLTSMIQQKAHVSAFLLHSDDTVRHVAKTPALRSLTSLFNRRGFPWAEEDTQAFMEWDIWWQGEGKARALDRELLRAFSSMFCGRGLPDKKAVEDYLQLDIWWRGDGKERVLDRELLRAFSSMFGRRGLPDKKAVEDYLRLDVWWQGEGQARVLDRELLRVFASMFNGRGLPDKKAVADYLRLDIWWQGEGQARTLDRQLLRAFSSMFNGRGLPDKKAVEDYLRLDVWWQGEGRARTLDRELLRAFSSMFHCRGLPDKQAVEDYLRLGVWYQGEGNERVLDRELLRAFSSMFCGRGLPDKKDVEDYLGLDIWWQGEGKARALDRELLRAFSSMFSGRGLPDKRAVEDYLQLDIWWQEKGKARTLDRELLRAFSAMFHGRGLPDKKAVEDYLQLDIWWQGEGQVRTLDRELLRVFSSMFCGKGLPDKKAVEDYLQWEIWRQGEGTARTLDWELLRAFSSMFSGRGLPDKKAVEDYLQWEIWRQGQDGARALDRELLRAFSSMFRGRGLPDKKAVEDYLLWEIWWQGKGKAQVLDRELLRVFSSMFNGKGLPDKLRTNEVMQWLSWKEQWNQSAITVMARLYSGIYAGHGSLGLPDINKLRQAEQKLTSLIPAKEYDQDDDDQLLPLIKIVALYLANDGGTRQLSWTDCEAWLQEYAGFFATQDVFRQLLLTLHNHGGRGVKETMALISGKPEATKQFVLDALGRGKALAAVQYALQAIEPSEWREYLFFTREIHPVPDRQQWQTIKGYLDVLSLVLPNQEYQRRFLTLIWPFSPGDRERFVQPDALRELSTLLPSVQVMRQLFKSLTTAELRTLFDTCLAYRKGQPDKLGLPILFKALLLAQLPPLFDRGAILPGILAQTHDQPKGVVIGGSPTLGVKDPVTLFLQVMAVILAEFWDCEYTVHGPTLTLWPHGSTVPITLPTPNLAWHPDGIQIRHWTSADLHRFYQATECWSGFYQEPLESNEPEQDPIAARLAERHRNRTADVAQQGERPVPYLSVAMLRGIVKNRVHMNRIAWVSADYHKDTLPPSLLTLLKERANADNDGLVPESLKTFLSERDQSSPVYATDPNLIVPNSPATWLETVLRQSVLSEADIDQLYIYRDQLTRDQVVDILLRIDQSVSQDTVQQWQQLLDDKHQQTLKTPPPWLDGSDQTREAMHDIEDILRDLFPDALL